MAGKPAKEFLLFSDLLFLWYFELIILSLFFMHTVWKKTQKRLKPLPFLTMQAKYIFALLWLSFTHSLPCSVSLFHLTNLKGIINIVFWTMARMQAKIVLRFFNCLSFTHPVLNFVSHAFYSKTIEKLLNSLVSLVSFLGKPTGVFSTYTPKMILLLILILRTDQMGNTKNTVQKRIVKIINN